MLLPPSGILFEALRIDYVIGSPFVLSKTPDFVVHDFDGVFSDKHSLVTWQMQSQCNINNLNVQQNQTFDDKKANGRIIWQNVMRDEYTQHICKDRIEILLGKIEIRTVQELITELNEILLDPAMRLKRKNGVKKIYKLKCYNHVIVDQWL